MANLLYLVHRLPFPPNKGDKVRSYHLLKHLAQRHRVFLGTFADDPDDLQHVPVLQALCADVQVCNLSPRRAKLKSLLALITGEPLTLRYYHDAALARWVRQTLATQAIDAVVVFSSSMAQYAPPSIGLPILVDLVDVDSAKWTQYAQMHAWPLSWLYRREGAQLLRYEETVVRSAQRSFLVTEQEVALLNTLAPGTQGHVEALSNGVDADYFAPDSARPSPYTPGESVLVFTGAMDYWPNVDAVTWFVQAMLPALRARWPALRLHIVGRSPTPAVRALAGEAVSVSGAVPDVRPYLQHALVAVAPLRLARGVQNKVLEAMAMACPVVAAAQCVQALSAVPGQEILPALEVADYLAAINNLLADAGRARAIGAAARCRVRQDASWSAKLQGIDRHLPTSRSQAGTLSANTDWIQA